MDIAYKYFADDIKCGKVYTRQSASHEVYKGKTRATNIEFTETVSYMVAYGSSLNNRRHYLISVGDGLMLGPFTKEEIAEKFNNDQYGYRPTCKDVLVQLAKLKSRREYE